MKNEAELNGILVKSLNQQGWAYKIPDQVSLTTGFGAPKPFDIIGIYRDIKGVGHPLYAESKLIKQPSAFNFNRLEDHQIENLLKCQKLLPNALVLFLVCVDFGRAEKRVYFYKNMQYLYERKQNKRSILKKEFEEASNYTIIRHGLINFEEILKGESYEI